MMVARFIYDFLAGEIEAVEGQKEGNVPSWFRLKERRCRWYREPRVPLAKQMVDQK